MTKGVLAPLCERVATSWPSLSGHGEIVVPHFAAAMVAAIVARGHHRSVIITSTSSEAEQLALALEAFLGDEVGVWPAWDIHSLERVSPDVSVMGRRSELRWRITQGRAPLIVVASVHAVTQVTPVGAVAAPVEVERGGEIDRDELLLRLVTLGYRREPTVEHRGEFAVRGGIVDLWPSQMDEPVRIDLFGDEVERLTIFDVADQRSLRDVDRIEVFAAREWALDDAQRRRATALADSQPWGRDIFQRLADGEVFDGMEAWLPWFATEGRSVIDDFPETPFVMVVDGERVHERAREILREEGDLAKAVGATWGATDDIPLFFWQRDVEDLPSLWKLSLSGAPHHASSPLVEFTSPPPLAGDVTRVADIAATWSPSQRGVIVTTSTQTANYLIEALRSRGLEVSDDPDDVGEVKMCVVVGGLPQGFVSPDGEFTVWSDTDVSGRRSVHRAPRSRARNVAGFFDGLSVGSYVVHRQHGVARYAGSTSREMNGALRDYLILEFKDGRSYWPSNQIDALTPYSGGDAPTLARMGSEQWQKTRAKARVAAMLVAQDLVDLYRERIAVTGHAFSPDTPWQFDMESLFPYALTVDQERAIEEVKSDMESPKPMDRLVCADVGFGKTEIAVRAIFKAVQDNKQAAFLVPTTLLASQHLATLLERFSGFPVRVAMLSRFVDEKETKKTLAGLKDGSVDVVVGTHRLLDANITFKDLGLLVVDEEQRFGVDHKEAIKKRAVGVDVLTLSASPIPRTLEMAFVGIRELSMVQTPPAERRPILTYVGEYNEAAVVEALRRELLREGQAFFVHNRVADIDLVAERIRELVPEARVAVAHGQMDEGTLERVVVDFWERKYDVLICTTIVESGIDMPSVNTLIVDRADRLGLGQLHQLRGRVGRGGARAYAYLFHPADHVLTETAFERLRTIGDNTALGAGFKIAMRDLEIRGAGNLLGHHQSGPVAAVGYDLYMQLVAEAVAEAKGEVVVVPNAVSIDISGDASIPVTYMPADDDRLEAYRRLSLVTTHEQLTDIRDEWLDRYGAVPVEAEGLLAVCELRVECLGMGITEAAILPAKAGIRSRPWGRLSPVTLSEAQQLWCRKNFDDVTYTDASHQLRLEMSPGAHARDLSDVIKFLRT